MITTFNKMLVNHSKAGIFSIPGFAKCCCSTTSNYAGLPKVKRALENQPHRFGQPTPVTHPHLMQAGEVTPGIQLEEYQDRRYKLMESIYKHASRQENNTKQKHVVVIPSASKVYMTEKIPYVFRQNTDFLYLSGCLEPDSALVLTGTQGEDFMSTLFVRKRDLQAELWDGPRTGIEESPTLFGVNQAYPVGEMDKFLASFSKSNRSFTLWYDFMQPTQMDVHKTMRDFLSNTWNKTWESPKKLIHHLRLYKSPAEIALMTKSCQIASDAIATTIKSSHPGVTEHQLFARVDYECRMNGAEFLAYPPVVASGDRANIIHYINNNQMVGHNDTILMDAGCEYHGYSSDITRTWPLSGKFSARQRELYEAVLSAQTELIAACAERPSLDELFSQMCATLGRNLRSLGFLPRNATEEDMARAAYSFCPHHVSHYLGMDVHDTASITRSINLEPGMIVTVEPGIYVNSRNKLAPPEYHGLGVRIEDDILITESGPVVLTQPCPKTIDEIENLFLAKNCDL